MEQDRKRHIPEDFLTSDEKRTKRRVSILQVALRGLRAALRLLVSTRASSVTDSVRIIAERSSMEYVETLIYYHYYY